MSEYFESRIRELVAQVDRIRIDPALTDEQRSEAIEDVERAIRDLKATYGNRTITGSLSR